MSTRAPRAVVVDTMTMSALMNASRNPERAAAYRRAINDGSILVSFVTITELRFGAELHPTAWPATTTSVGPGIHVGGGHLAVDIVHICADERVAQMGRL